MKSGRILIPILIVSMAANTAILNARTWTEAGTGRTLEGDFVNVDGANNVVIKRADGKTVNVPIGRLSAADQAFVKAQAEAKSPSPSPKGAEDGGPFGQLSPPVTVTATAIKGKGEERKAELKLKNTGDRGIASLVVEMFFLREDGSVGKGVPHTKSGFSGERKNILGRGKSSTIEVSSFFMEDDTAAIDGDVSSIEFDDGSAWPAPPTTPPARNGEDPVAAKMVGLLGSGDRARPAVACHNYDSKAVTGVNYSIEYLDADGKVLDRTSYGYIGEDPLMKTGKGKVFAGGDGPPEGAADARVKVSSVTFADESKWTPAN